MVKEVIFKTNLKEINDNHNETYFNDRGIIIIEMDNGKKYILDIDAQADLSDCDYIRFEDTDITKEIVLFKNIVFDVEQLAKLAGKKIESEE